MVEGHAVLAQDGQLTCVPNDARGWRRIGARAALELDRARLRRHVKLEYPPAGSGLSTSCWLWTASRATHRGAGRFKLAGRQVPAHRASFLLFVGPIPVEHRVGQRCGRKLCLRPEHLMLHAPLPPAPPPPPRHYRSTLTPDDTRAIAAAPGRATDVARAFGVHLSTVYRMRSRLREGTA